MNNRGSVLILILLILMGILLMLGGLRSPTITKTGDQYELAEATEYGFGFLQMLLSDFYETHRNYLRVVAINLAEAGVDRAINKLNASWTSFATEYYDLVNEALVINYDTLTNAQRNTDKRFWVCAYSANVINSSEAAVTGIGYVKEAFVSDKFRFNVSKKITISLKRGNAGNIKAAATTNYATETLGNMIIDGRNHDLDGEVIPGSGLLAVHTTSTYSRSGNAQLAGTVAGSDSSLGQTYNPPNIVTTSASWPGGYPSSPDAFINYPEGTLKSKAKSKANGGQYVTDPANLTTPLSGVTYVEISDTWIVGAVDLSGTGLLVVHSLSGYSAAIKNFNAGVFKGLIIADDIVNIHATIIGAVVTLSPNPSEGNCLGNGDPDSNILYSSQAIADAFNAVGKSINYWTEEIIPRGASEDL